MDPRRPRRGMFLLPSLITVGNMFCGYAAIMYAMRGDVFVAAPFIGVAFILDMLDGRIARMTGTASAFAFPHGLTGLPQLLAAVAVVIVPAILMVSTIRFRSFKTLNFGYQRGYMPLFFFAIFVVLV